MKLALAVLCIGAITFLLRFLIALVKDEMNSSPRTTKFQFAKVSLSRRREQLVVVNPEAYTRRVLRRKGERMAV